MSRFTACNFIQLVYKYYPHILSTIQCILRNLFLVDQLLGFFLLNNFSRFAYWSFFHLCFWWYHFFNYVLKINSYFFYSSNNALHNNRPFLCFDLHHTVFKFTLSQLIPEFLAGCFQFFCNCNYSLFITVNTFPANNLRLFLYFRHWE